VKCFMLIAAITSWASRLDANFLQIPEQSHKFPRDFVVRGLSDD
jgi:hypothetical protein